VVVGVVLEAGAKNITMRVAPPILNSVRKSGEERLGDA